MNQCISRRTVTKFPMAKIALGIAFVAMPLISFSAAPLMAAGGNYHLLKKVVLGGEGGWDYLLCDSTARRVYISRGTHVMVIDADRYAVVGDIPGTEGVQIGRAHV